MESNKSGSTFYDKSGDAILFTTPNFWDNIQMVRTHILKYDIPNSVIFATRYLDFETLYYCFEHVSDEVMHYILDNVKNAKKIHFPVQKHIYCSCTLRKIH